MKKILILIILIGYSFGVSAQSLKDRFFHSSGFSFLCNYRSLPLRSYTSTDTKSFDYGAEKDVEYNGSVSTNVFNIVTYIYEPRFNIVEFTQESSLSLNVPLQLGLGFSYVSGSAVSNDPIFASNDQSNYKTTDDAFGLLTFSFPIFLQGNFGMGSTYSSGKDNGFTVGIGIDQGIAPIALIKFNEYDSKKSTGGFSRYYAMPALNLGYCFFSRGDKPHMVNLMLSYSGSDSKQYVETPSLSSSSPNDYIYHTVSTAGFGFLLSYRFLIGY